jgi:hypothetical protein
VTSEEDEQKKSDGRRFEPQATSHKPQGNKEVTGDR